MLLVYTHKITPRFSYIMKHILTRILGIEILFTTKVEDFIKHNGPKITYTKQPLQNEFFIRSNDLLFEKGINDLQINVGELGRCSMLFYRRGALQCSLRHFFGLFLSAEQVRGIPAPCKGHSR